MRPNEWATWGPDTIVHRRAGGRRRHNAQRRMRAETRRRLLVARLPWTLELPRGLAAQLARELNVSPATISRDLRRVSRPLSDEETRALFDRLARDTERDLPIVLADLERQNADLDALLRDVDALIALREQSSY
jgi:transcriptional antiterminator